MVNDQHWSYTVQVCAHTVYTPGSRNDIRERSFVCGNAEVSGVRLEEAEQGSRQGPGSLDLQAVTQSSGDETRHRAGQALNMLKRRDRMR